MYKTVEFQREKLFTKVWSEPLLKLAQSIGISDVALAKACRRAEIPLPGRGYWAKAENTRPAQPKLPKLKNPYYQTIRFSVADTTQLSPSVQTRPEKGPPIAVPSSLNALHALVARTLKGAAKAKVVQGCLQLDKQKALDIQVSPGTLDRTLRLIDALIKASEAQGHLWKITQDAKTVVTVNGQSFHLCVREKLDRHELPPPPPPPRLPKHRWEPDLEALLRPRVIYEWTPTGRLSINIDGLWHDRTVQKNWNDTDRTLLEAKLHEVLSGFAPAAVAIEAHREEQERRRIEEEKRAIQREAAARHRAHQQRLRLRLVQSTKRWEQAQRLRAFCSAVQVQLETLSLEDQAAGQAWLQWAEHEINQLDPLQGNLESLFNLTPPKDTWLSSSEASGTEDDWWRMM